MSEPSEEGQKREFDRPQSNDVQELLSEQDSQPIHQMSYVVGRRSFCAIANIEGKVDKIQRSAYVPKDGACKQNQPCEQKKDIVIVYSTEDVKADIDSEGEEAERNADAGPYHTL